MTLPFSWAPEGWSSCAGQVTNLAQYQALYSLIGTIYGGNGSSTFGLPDLRGRSVVGAGAAFGNTYTVGATGGAATATLTANDLPPHTHSAVFVPSTSNSTNATVTATVTGLDSNVALSATYNAVSATGATGVPSAGASLGTANPAVTKLYTSSTTGTAVPIGTVTATGNLTGTLSVNATGAYPASGGGSVLVGPSGAGQPFSILPPYVSMNVVIATNGIYPPRP
jgi:microcystin-dependent protein